MPRNDKPFLNLYTKLKSYNYQFDWKEYCDNIYVNEVLSHCSKAKTDNIGYPDFIYINEVKKLLILVELKTSICLL